jgi:hypothetical protein
MPPHVAQLESDTRHLAAQVRALIVERDRPAGRIVLLENSINDMTGAIGKQAAATWMWPKRVLQHPPHWLPRQQHRVSRDRHSNDCRRFGTAAY